MKQTPIATLSIAMLALALCAIAPGSRPAAALIRPQNQFFCSNPHGDFDGCVYRCGSNNDPSKCVQGPGYQQCVINTAAEYQACTQDCNYFYCDPY